MFLTTLIVFGQLLCGTLASNQGVLTLNKIDQQSKSPNAKCIDGSSPAYYWRDGVNADAKKAVLFLEGGGWCYPSSRQSAGANCAVRATSGLGSSKSYPPTIASTGYEGGSGYLSGDSAVTAFADFAVAYVKYCDGGSMTGTQMAPQIRNDTATPLYYRGHYNLIAQLDHMIDNHNLATFSEIVLSGCSAGGMACYLKCDFVAEYFKPHGIPVKCICDAGVFLDVDTVTGAGNVMRARYFDIADNMATKDGLPAACVAEETDWRLCQFSQYAIKYMKTPTFVINSLYNFGEWAMLAPMYNGSFPSDSGTPPPDWQACYPGNGKLSPQSFAHCNATQVAIIQGFRLKFITAVAAALDPSSQHGAFLDACPNQHCQTSTGWSMVHVNNTTMAEAAARWYFNASVEKHIDAPFSAPLNPTCGYKEGIEPICNNCAIAGLGSNCIWDEKAQKFRGLNQ